jgi:hypothetical protein
MQPGAPPTRPYWGPPPGAPGAYPPPGMPPAPKKSGHGCLIALGVTGAVLLVLVILVVVVVHRAATSPEGRKVLGIVRDTARVVGESASAPGTKEIRDLGCDSAMVMDLGAWMKIFALDGGTPRPAPELDLFVICGAGVFKTPPTCERVAEAYVTAVGGTARGPFQAMVQKQGRNRPLCAVCYDARGTRQACPRGAMTATE